MREELNLVFKATEDNLARIRESESAACELCMFELSDISLALTESIEPLYKDGLGVYDLFAYIKDSESFTTGTKASGDAMFYELVRGVLASRTELDKGAFCALFADGLVTLGIKESDFLPSGKRNESFTYVKNVFADEAYDVLSADFDDARVRYSRDFSECLRLIYSKEVSYALLPFEERGGTRLASVLELIYRNDLKINAVTPVFGPDGMADLKYALVSESFTVDEATPGDDRYLEIRIKDDKGGELSSLLSVAVMLGYTVYRVNTHKFLTEEGGDGFYSVVIRDEGRSFLPLLTYLTLFIDDYIPVGIYKNLE